MALIEKLEDILAWQKAGELVAEASRLPSSCETSVEYSPNERVRELAYAIQANIKSGFDQPSNSDFVDALCIARASSTELRVQLDQLRSNGSVKDATFNSLVTLTQDVERILGAFINYLAKAPDRALQSFSN